MPGGLFDSNKVGPEDRKRWNRMVEIMRRVESAHWVTTPDQGAKDFEELADLGRAMEHPDAMDSGLRQWGKYIFNVGTHNPENFGQDSLQVLYDIGLMDDAFFALRACRLAYNLWLGDHLPLEEGLKVARQMAARYPGSAEIQEVLTAFGRSSRRDAYQRFVADSD